MTTTEFSEKVHLALRGAFSELLSANEGQAFYAFALFTDDSLQFVHPVANTEEALTSTVRRYRETVDPKFGSTSTRNEMRWSYGDWGFFPDVGGHHFDEINTIVRANVDGPDEAFEAQLGPLWDALVEGFRRLELDQFFGTGANLSKVTLLVVGDLPEEVIDNWVVALNPKEVADRYVNWDPDAPDESVEDVNIPAL
jgi:Domain of unknown function (DUF4303)